MIAYFYRNIGTPTNFLFSNSASGLGRESGLGHVLEKATLAAPKTIASTIE